MFKKLTDDARLPERATRYSAGFDVFANEDVVIGAGETKLIGLGIALDEVEILKAYAKKAGILDLLKADFLEKYYFALHIRSSLRAKGLTSLGTGIIDMDFMHEIKMVIHNPMTHKNVSSLSGLAILEFQSLIFGFGDEQSKKARELYVEQQKDNLSAHIIKKGDKIGQLILCRHEGYLMPSEYTKDEERTGGFGSTGK